MLKQTTLRALAPLSLALALATGGLALSAPALANQAARPAEAVSASATLTAPAPLVNAAELKTLLGQPGVRVLDTDVPAIEAYPRAASRGLPVHRVEYRQPAGRTAPAALETMRALAGELFPAWQERFALVAGRGNAGGAGHGQRT